MANDDDVGFACVSVLRNLAIDRAGWAALRPLTDVAASILRIADRGDDADNGVGAGEVGGAGWRRSPNPQH